MIRIRATHCNSYEVLVDAPDLDTVEPMIITLQGLGYRPAGDSGDGWAAHA